MNLDAYRDSPLERLRTDDLMQLLPGGLTRALDVGARDGFLSRLLADRVGRVTALDLERPCIEDDRIDCVHGDATALTFADRAFDLVFCAEVLEHIPSPALEAACAEICRVSGTYLLIGVPFKQDTRLWRTTCRQCDHTNPPWGHVNSFDIDKLAALFSAFDVVKTSFVGQAEMGTNAFSAWLMDLAGNPYGTYSQDEPCGHCGAALVAPASRSVTQRLLCRAALVIRRGVNFGRSQHANWIHVLFQRRESTVAV